MRHEVDIQLSLGRDIQLLLEVDTQPFPGRDIPLHLAVDILPYFVLGILHGAVVLEMHYWDLVVEIHQDSDTWLVGRVKFFYYNVSHTRVLFFLTCREYSVYNAQ